MSVSPFPRSQALYDAARRVIPGGVTSSIRAGARPHPLYFERGEGPCLWDVDGNRYVDYALGYGPSSSATHRESCATRSARSWTST